MRRPAKFLALVFMGCAIGSLPLHARSTAVPEADLVHVVVTVKRLKPAAPATLAREDILVYQNKERRPVVNWVPARTQQARLDMAVLVDDSLDTSLGNQLSDLAAFIRSLPPASMVAVAYADKGNAVFTQHFTTDQALAAKALRLPMGRTEAGGSIYQSVADLLKHFPQDGNRHEVLLISDGIDLFWGVVESEPDLNSDLQRAIDAAQRGGVPVYTIFATDASQLSSNLSLLDNGQGCLTRLAHETGGAAYFQGLQTPIAFIPYLHMLEKILGEQSLLTFRAKLGRRSGYEPLRVTTEQPEVKLIAPTHVYVRAAS